MRIPAPNYTQTPNDLFDYWLPLLGEAELKVLLVILRKTVGWHKVRDKISISQLSTITGLHEESVIKATRSLQKKGVIIKNVVGPIGKQETFYELVIQEDSNNSYPSDKPSGPLGFNPHDKTETQKKVLNTKETTTPKERKNAAVFSESKKKDSNVSIYSCLADLDIPLSDKEEICRRYDEQTVKNAAEWSQHPETKINKTLAQALKWACAKKMIAPKGVADHQKDNRSYAKKYDNMKKGSYTVNVLSKCIEIDYGTAYKQPFTLEYTAKGFKEQLDSVLIKCGFKLIT